MDTAQWSQGIGLMKPLEELVGSQAVISIPTTTNTNTTAATTMTCTPSAPRGVNRSQKGEQGHQRGKPSTACPRCNSANTKFCYYNNYSMTQPRYFCKTCRRYWTEGGSLRNVPVGGGSRKNKRSFSSSSSATTLSSLPLSSACSYSSSIRNPVSSIHIPAQNPKFQHGQDLNLAFPDQPAAISAMDLLRGGMPTTGFSPFMVGDNAVFSPGFAQIHDFRPPPATAAEFNFPLNPASTGRMAAMQDGSNGRLLFPFEDLRQVSSATAEEFEQKAGHGGEGEASGFWTGMMGGNGGSW